MILHIAPDEKFLDSAIELFEAVESEGNLFLIRLGPDNKLPRYVTSKSTNVHFLSEATFVESVKEYLGHCCAIVLHGLDGIAADLIPTIPRHVSVVWLSWGYDIYTAFPSFQHELFKVRTRAIISKLSTRGPRNFLLPLKAILFRSGIRYSQSLRSRLNAIRRIDVCATVLPQEWKIVRRLGFQGHFARFNYSWIEKMIPDELQNPTILGRDILIGNSSTATSNHLDIFYDLKRLNLNARRIVVPLSYGDKKYQQAILTYGKEIFGAQFLPLIDFMRNDQYARVLSNCGTVIMNHLRQQALGNICTSLFLGAKLFLNDSNPANSFLKTIGVKSFSLQRDFDLIGKDGIGLTQREVSSNRSALLKEYSKKISIQRTCDLVDMLRKETKAKI